MRFFVRDFCYINSHEESGTIKICAEETKSDFNMYKQNSGSNFKLFMSKLPYMVPYSIQKRRYNYRYYSIHADTFGQSLANFLLTA